MSSKWNKLMEEVGQVEYTVFASCTPPRKMNTKYLTIEEFDKKIRSDLNKFTKYVITNQEKDEWLNETHSEEDWYGEFADYILEQENKDE